MRQLRQAGKSRAGKLQAGKPQAARSHAGRRQAPAHHAVDRQALAVAVYGALQGRVSRTCARRLVDDLVEIIVCALVRDGEVKLHRFGKFVVREKAERMGRNPKDGQMYPIAARKSVSFYPARDFKDAVKKRR